jgi:hypothetical protein
MTSSRSNGRGGGSLRKDVQAISANLDDLQAYPQLTESVSYEARGSTQGAAGRSPVGQIVDSVLRETLAWRPRTSDPKGFAAALDQAFAITEVDGHTEWSWTPRSYAIQADMGAVTGAQASIYARAKAAMDQSIPLLEGLYPLRSDADAQDAEAIRSLVRAALTELVSELGQVGGPRLQRVESHFTALMGDVNEEDPERMGGLLGQLRDQFGMERRRVNTIAEEQDLTNYLILVDHVIGLQRSWKKQHHFFNRFGADVYLGTQLVLLSRSLGVVAEATQEVRDALDSVYIRSAERQTIKLNLQQQGEPGFLITIGELLEWIETVATIEGPRSINDGGKDGVIALRPVLKQLHLLAAKMEDLSNGPFNPNRNNIPRGFFTSRVQVALAGLEASLNEARDLAEQMRRTPAPRIYDVEASDIDAQGLWRPYIEGENFQPGAKIRFEPKESANTTPPPTARRAHFVSPTALRATVHVPEAAIDDDWLMVVENPDGGESQPWDITFDDSNLPPGGLVSSGTPPPTGPSLTGSPPFGSPPPAGSPPSSSLLIGASASAGSSSAGIVTSIVLLNNGKIVETFDKLPPDRILKAPAMFDEIQINFSKPIRKNTATENSVRVSTQRAGTLQQIKTKVTAESQVVSSKLEEPLVAGAAYKVLLIGTGSVAIKMNNNSRLTGGDFGFTIDVP